MPYETSWFTALKPRCQQKSRRKMDVSLSCALHTHRNPTQPDCCPVDSVFTLPDPQNRRGAEAGKGLWGAAGPPPCSSRATASQLPRTVSRQLGASSGLRGRMEQTYKIQIKAPDRTLPSLPHQGRTWVSGRGVLKAKPTAKGIPRATLQSRKVLKTICPRRQSRVCDTRAAAGPWTRCNALLPKSTSGCSGHGFTAKAEGGDPAASLGVCKDTEAAQPQSPGAQHQQLQRLAE